MKLSVPSLKAPTPQKFCACGKRISTSKETCLECLSRMYFTAIDPAIEAHKAYLANPCEEKRKAASLARQKAQEETGRMKMTNDAAKWLVRPKA